MDSFNGTALDMFQRRMRPITNDQFEADPVLTLMHCVEVCSNNPLYTEMYEDNGTVDGDSQRGLMLVNQAQAFIKKADEALKGGDYSLAVSFSTKGLEIAEQVKCNGVQKMIAYDIRAHANYNLKDYKSAFSDIAKTLTYEPRRLDAVFLLIKIFSAMEKFVKAFQLCIATLLRYKKVLPTFIHIMKQAVILAPKVRNGFQELKEIQDVQIDDEIWNEVVHELAKDNAWSLVKILLLGTDDVTGVEMSLAAKGINLSGLLDYCDITPWKQWGQKLTLLLLRHGADYKTLCPKSKFPLHRSLKIGLNSDSFDLLKELFAKYIKSEEVNETDENGNTLLHQACRDQSTARSTAIKLLLNHNVDAMLKNKLGKLAHELLPEGDFDRKRMQEIIDQKAKPNIGSSTAPKGAGTILPEPKYVINHKWSQIRIQRWLDECGLKDCKQRFHQIEGSVLCELCILQNQCPDVFYKILHEDFKLDFVNILKVSAALRDCKPDAY